MITARGLTKRFGSTFAERDLSSEGCPGVVTGFLGPHGAPMALSAAAVPVLGAPRLSWCDA